VIRGAFVGERNFDVIKMHGTTTEILNLIVQTELHKGVLVADISEKNYPPHLQGRSSPRSA
jgi:hypothetical protein